MGIADKVSQLAGNVQQGVKDSSVSILSLTIKLVTCFFFALTFALIGQEMMTYGTFMFVFMLLVVGGLLYKLLAPWNIGSVLIFDLVCILVALLLRMYILVAP